MGIIQHDAIIVTGVDLDGDTPIKDLHGIAQGIFPYVSPILGPTVNFYTHFFIPPDGSKEGWQESGAGDARRDEFLERAEAYRGRVSVICVSYGELRTSVVDFWHDG